MTHPRRCSAGGPPRPLASAAGAALALLLACATAITAADEPVAPPAAQRSAFIDAERALASGDAEAFAELSEQLRDYPLWPYLRLAELEGRIPGAADDAAVAQQIESFIARYAGTAPGETLRRRWLNALHARGDAAGYVRNYRDIGSETRTCRYRAALLALGREQDALDGLEDLYLTGASLPDACDPVVAAWSAAGGLRADLVWQRVGLALARRNIGVAIFQRRYLPEEQRRWLDQMVALYRRPESMEEADLPGEPALRAAALVGGIEQLARKDPRRAAALWGVLQDREPLTPSATDRANAVVGAALARAGEHTGLVYLRRVRPVPESLELQRERLRAALRLRAWPDLVGWIEALPEAERDRGEWQYWLARALGKRGDLVGAAHALDQAADARDLWGFRAAELLGRPPALHERPVPADPLEIDRLLASDTVLRIRELKGLGRTADASREWRELTRDAGTGQLRTAALLGQRLGLVSESIFTLARGGYWDDMGLRFPLMYRDLVEASARRYGLPPEWVFAVIRQESAFDADVASHAGAVGLMQLMPGTARDMARDAGLPPPDRLDLIDPALNIELGTRYLAAMRERFGGNAVLATAAYNAGPAAVGRWLPETRTAADLWMTEIPYRETRDYVRRVLTYRVIYAQRLGEEGFRVGALLPPVLPSGVAPGLAPDLAAERSAEQRATSSSVPAGAHAPWPSATAASTADGF